MSGPFITYCEIHFFASILFFGQKYPRTKVYLGNIFWPGAFCGPPGFYWFWSKENLDSMKACLSWQTKGLEQQNVFHF